jgi:hypothetical protein
LNNIKAKTFELLDKTNFLNCSSYDLLSSLNYDSGSLDLINKIITSCKYLSENNLEKFEETLKPINFDSYK